MPLWSYVCRKGHVTDRFFESHAERTRTTRCDCGARATLNLSATHRKLYVTPDIEEHYNTTIDMPVRSRKHLKDLQRRYGFSDHDKGVQKPSSNWRTKHAEAKKLLEAGINRGASRPDVEPDGAPIVLPEYVMERP